MFREHVKLDKHGSKYRIREYLAAGHPPETFYYETREEGERHIREFRAETGQLTMGEALRDYFEDLRRFGGKRTRGLTASGLKMRESKLVHILNLVDREAMDRQRGKKVQERVYNDRPLTDLTPTEAQALYTRLVKLEAEGELSAATHQGYLIAAKGFGQWLVESRKMDVNPFKDVRAEGTANKGKDKLSLDQARRFILACYEDPHPLGGVACAMMLTLGTRSHEILERPIDQLDDNGSVLDIQKSKSKAGERKLNLPPVLRAKVRELVKGRPVGELIFRGMTNNTLLGHVKRLCEVANVPQICAHGLRDTWTDLTMKVMEHLERTSKTMGHADTKVTLGSYMSPGVMDSMRANMMEELLLSAPAEQTESDEQIADRELREAEEKLAALKAKRMGLQPAKVALPVGRTLVQPVPHLKSVG